MKICDLTQSYTETSGGIKSYIHEKQKYILQHTKHEHILIVPGERDSISRQGRITLCRVQAPYIKGCEPFRFILRLDKVYKLLATLQPDVVELGSAYVLPYPALLYRYNFGKPVIGFYHTDYPTSYVKPAMTTLLGPRIGDESEKLSSHYARFVYNQFDATVTASTALFKKLIKQKFCRLEHIELGVDLEVFNPKHRDENLRRFLGLNGEELFLFYHGRFDSEKRIDILLESFNRISPRVKGRLFLMGDGPLKEYAIQQSQQNAKIHILPYESDRQNLAKYLASADIYCTASPHETFGLSIVEAQASGLAVCGVKAGALCERVPGHVGVLSQANSIDSFAKTLLELSENGFRQQGVNARRFVEVTFSWQKSFTKLFQLYDDCVQKY